SLIFPTIAAGVPGGATRANQPDAANPGIVSDTVARSGRVAKRSVEATASNLNCPVARGPPRPSTRTGTRPLRTSLTACGAPGTKTDVRFAPGPLRKSTGVKWR